MMKKLLFLIATLYPTASFADAIELLGINLSMTLEEQQHALSQSGYECMEKKYPWGTTYFTCKNGEKEIVPSEEKIRFSCANFNACNLSLRELSQAVVDQKIVSTLEYEPKYVNEGQTLIERYCGRGVDGDLLCVVADKNILGETMLTITVEKGTLGSGGVTFE